MTAPSATMNEAESALLRCYEELGRILEHHGHELAPFEQRNALKALASLWQVANGLDRDPGPLYDLGV